MADNHFKTKRAAHKEGRSNADQWNPFRHVSWRKNDGRAETWAGNRLEAQSDNPEFTRNHLTQAVTAPQQSHREDLGDDDEIRRTPTDETHGVGNMNTSAGLDINEKSSTPRRETDTGVSGLRNRKGQEEDGKENGMLSRGNSGLDDDDAKKKSKKEDSTFFKHVYPKEPFTVANQMQRTFLSSWINILILAAPAGIAMSYVGDLKEKQAGAVFAVNFLAIIPLAAMLSFATEEVALRTGETLGGLINATFGNAVELIVAILALADNQVVVVQTSLIGSILSNLLLVMGCCFLFGGLRRTEQHFNQTVAQTAASLLALAAASVIVPSVFDYATPETKDPSVKQANIAKLSRGTSLILLLVYAAYLFFQLKTHQSVFNEESKKVPMKPWNHGGVGSGAIKQGLALPSGLMGHAMPDPDENERLSKMLMNSRQMDDADEEEEPQLHFLVAVATLTVATVIIAFCAEGMVGSIDGITENGGLKKEFVGLILLPIVGNAAEHATAVTVAMKDKMDLAIGVAVGSSMQVALFLIPLMVVIGWGMDNQAMDLSFDMFQVAVMFVAVLLTNYLIGDGKSHWLEGFLLICLYAIIGVCAFCKYRGGRAPRFYTILTQSLFQSTQMTLPLGSQVAAVAAASSRSNFVLGCKGFTFALFLFSDTSLCAFIIFHCVVTIKKVVPCRPEPANIFLSLYLALRHYENLYFRPTVAHEISYWIGWPVITI